MKKIVGTALALCLLAVTTTGCHTTKQQTGAIIGGAAGAGIGLGVSGGHPAAGIGGAAAGAYIGSRVADH